MLKSKKIDPSLFVNEKKKLAHVSIPTGEGLLPIEIRIVGELAPGAGKYFISNALRRQEKHPEYIDEFNEPSALIGKTDFKKEDPTAVYTFAVDTRDLVFH